MSLYFTLNITINASIHYYLNLLCAQLSKNLSFAFANAHALTWKYFSQSLPFRHNVNGQCQEIVHLSAALQKEYLLRTGSTLINWTAYEY